MIQFMRRTDSPYLADLFAISLRWLVLFGLAIALGAGGALAAGEQPQPFIFRILALVAPALWNCFVTVLAIFNRRLGWHRQINVALDVVFSLLVLGSTSAFHWETFWTGLLPIFSAAIYFNAPVVLATAAVTSLLQAGVLLLTRQPQLSWTVAGSMLGFNLAASLVSILLSAPLLTTLRHRYQGTVNQRREGERKAQHQEHERMRALFSMLETISSTLNYQKVIETIVETAIAAVGDDQDEAGEMVGCVLLFDRRQNLEVHAAKGFAKPDLAMKITPRHGILYETLKSGEAHLLQNPNNDAELNNLATLKSRQSVVCLPLIRGFHAFGVMLFAHADGGFFTPERIDALQMLSHQAVIALQNAQLYQDLAHEKERLVQIQEDTQKKLARDLHDGPTQSLSAIAMRIHIVRKLLEISQNSATLDTITTTLNEMKEELKKIEELAKHTTQEIRHMLFTLRPLVLETEGLEAALKTMAEKMDETYQQKVSVTLQPGVAERLDISRQTVVFYLADEAVNNARKHAHAAEIQINMALMPDDDCIAILEIADNGIGFNVNSVMSAYDRSGSLGMVNLHERAEMINGLLRIESTPGIGTRVKIYIPLSEQAFDHLLQIK